MKSSPILTLEQAADYLQILPDELRGELEQGHIPGRNIAGKWRINQDALDKFLSGFEIVQVGTPTKVCSEINTDLASEEQSDTLTQSFYAKSIDSTSEKHSVNTSEKEATDVVPMSNGNASDSADVSETSLHTSPETEKEATDVVPMSNGNASDSATSSESPLHTSTQQNSERIVARIFSYNEEQGFGYARMSDNKKIMFDSKYIIASYPMPFPGRIIEFGLKTTKKGRLLPIEICVLEDDTAETRSQQKEDAQIQPVEIKQTRLPNSQEETNDTNSFSTQKVFHSSKYIPPQGTKESQSIYARAALANTEGRYDDARKLFKKALESGAGLQAYLAFAKMEQERGSRNEALRILKEATSLFPDQANLYVMYGQMERRNRNYRRAEEIFRTGLQHIPNDVGLRTGLAQTLVQIGSENSLNEAGQIFSSLEKERKINKKDRLYQRFQVLQRNPRANKVYDFFQTGAEMRVGIAGQRDLPQHITDIIVETHNQELEESFGLSGGILVRCFQHPARQAEIVNLKDYLVHLKPNDLIGLREGREVVLNRSLAFVAVPDSSKIRDQIMSILSESSEAIVPIDDANLQTTSSEEVLNTLRDLLGHYLGQRDLYNSTGPVYGVSGRRFFGRERLLVQLADDVSRGQFIGIYGLRKMGKTSLVYQLRDEKLQGDAVAYIDLQASHAQMTHNCHPLYYELERDLYVRLSTRDINAASLLRLGKYERYSTLPMEPKDIPLTFAEDMRAMLDELSEKKITSIKKIVIVLDELERILPVSGQDGVQGYLEFFGLLRGLMQTERYRGLLSSVVVAANASISERGYWEGRENPVFALYKAVFLPPFSIDECHEMIRTLGRGMSIRWKDDALHAVFTETGGHPFLTRLFCSRIARKHKNRPLIVTSEMVHNQITPFIREEGDKLEQITELLHINFPQEAEFLLQIALDETPEHVSDESLRHLLGYQLVIPDGTQYAITLKLLRRWLRRKAGIQDE